VLLSGADPETIAVCLQVRCRRERASCAGVMSDSLAASVAFNSGASPEVPMCFAPGDQGLLGLRLGGLFGILLASTAGVFIPFFTYKAKLNSVYFLLRAFAAGVVLTTG